MATGGRATGYWQRGCYKPGGAGNGLGEVLCGAWAVGRLGATTDSYTLGILVTGHGAGRNGQGAALLPCYAVPAAAVNRGTP